MMLYGCPSTVTECRLKESSAAPLNFPAFFTCVTVPETSERAGMATLPPSVIGVITVPVNVAPFCKVLVLSASLVRMVRMVPVGTTTGGGGGGGGGGAGAGAGVAAASRPAGAAG